MSTRKIHQNPTFIQVDDEREQKRIQLELKKLKPLVEVTTENHPAVSKGQIIEWDETKKLFTVKWSRLTKEFFSSSGERTGIRAFFKVNLISCPLLFKCELIRRLPDESFQYRIPLQYFKNQKRSALRLPLEEGAGKLKTPQGTFPILDLSVSGARISISEKRSRNIHSLEACSLFLLGRRIHAPDFGIRITSRMEHSAGCRFHGLQNSHQIEIKQFLIEALHEYYKKVTKK